MHQAIEQYWLAARSHEASGDLLAAREAYQAILRLDPSQALAWLRLSYGAQVAGRYREAHMAAMHGARSAVTNKRWKVLPYLTGQLLTFDERGTVRDVIERADWSSPAIISQSPVLAQQLWLADAHESALGLADLAITHTPSSHLLEHVRGNVLKQLGRMSEATQAFERCLHLAPSFADAHWSLAYHIKADPPESRVERIVSARKAWSAEALEQVYLGYALFKELDNAGRIEKAWEALITAARLMRGKLQHDPLREQEFVRTLLSAVNEPFIGPEQKPSDGRVPVFIVGLPRTGTTLLDRVLSNHSRVASAGELNVFSNCLRWQTDHFYDLPATAPTMHKLLHADFDAVGALYLSRTANLHSQASHLIDKNPANVFNAGFIAKALPQARIVCLMRNPMDACFSNLKELFSGNSYAYSYDLHELADHYTLFRELVAHWQEVMPGRFQVVEYEDLVTDPTRVSEQVMRFCGLDFEPHCVDITRNLAPVSTASSSQVRSPIHTDNIDAWRKYERYLGPLRERLRINSML